MSIRILLVDDEPLVLKAMSRALRAKVEVKLAHSAEEARVALAAESFDAVVTDERMPGEQGIGLLTWLRRTHPSVRRVLTSGGAVPALEEAIADGTVQVFLRKPAPAQHILDAVLRAA